MLTKLITIVSFILPSYIGYSRAISLRLLEPIDISVEVYNYSNSYKLNELDKNVAYGAFNLDFMLVQYKHISLYTLNKVIYDKITNNGRLNNYNWQNEVGLEFYKCFDIFKQHNDRMPLYDRYGLRIRFY